MPAMHCGFQFDYYNSITRQSGIQSTTHQILKLDFRNLFGLVGLNTDGGVTKQEIMKFSFHSSLISELMKPECFGAMNGFINENGNWLELRS